MTAHPDQTASHAADARAGAPVGMATLGILVLTVMDGMMKKLTLGHPVAEIAFARFFLAALMCLPLAFVARVGLPSRATLKGQALRGVFTLATSLLFITALKHLPLSEAITISFLAPSLVAAFARVLLGERVSRLTGWSIAISFLGVLVIARDDIANWRNPGEDAVGILAALGAAFAYAMSLTLLRARAKADGMIVSVVVQNIILSLLLAPIAIWQIGGAPLVGLSADWPTALCIGALGSAGHLLLAYAYARAPAARIGAVEYTALVWALILGFFWFGEWPTSSVLIGAALIVGGSSLLLIRR
jgi:S-adenosylmethionine uptake transporter